MPEQNRRKAGWRPAPGAQRNVDGSAAPPVPEKKASPIWNAIKWLAGGAILGIASFEGVRLYKKVRGVNDDPDKPIANPGQQQALPAMSNVQPSVMHFPFPIPYPMGGMGGMGHPTAAAEPQRNPRTIILEGGSGKGAKGKKRYTDEDIERLILAMEDDD